MDIDPSVFSEAPEWAVLLLLFVQQALRAVAQRQGTSPEARLERIEGAVQASGDRLQRRLDELDARIDRIELGCPVARGEGCPAIRLLHKQEKEEEAEAYHG